jgi:hypothetical protein
VPGQNFRCPKLTLSMSLRSRLKEIFSGGFGCVGALVCFAGYVFVAGTSLKYDQRVIGIGSFQPDWINYLVGTFFPPVLVFALLALILDGIGFLLSHI